MNEQESNSNEYLKPPLWHGNIVFGKVALRLSLQQRDARGKGVKSFKHIAPEELDEPFEHTASAILHRLLVLGLYLSFLGCLSGLWLTAKSPGNPDQLLPNDIAHFIATRYAIVLLVPLLSLFICYFLLRHITYDILAWPERFLDERQQMVRDQAHRYAYKFVKVACLLVPLYLCLHAVLWTAPAPASTQVPTPAQTTTIITTHIQPTKFFVVLKPNTLFQIAQIYSFPLPIAGQTSTFHGTVLQQPILIIDEKVPPYTLYSTYTITRIMAPPSYQQATTAIAPSWPDSPASLLLYYGTLLLSLFLLAIALPMSIVAWKERM